MCICKCGFTLLFSFFLFTENRRVIILGDSIIKDLPPIDGVTVKAFPGATIASLTHKIDVGQVDVSNYDFLIVHVGTNNIGNRHSFSAIVSDYGNLIGRIKTYKPSIRIIVSSILPRPCDHADTDSMIKNINKALRLEMASDLGFKFIESWKAVSKFGSFRRYLFAKHDNGLHLNTEGKRRLRYFFLRVISTLD